MNAMACRSRRQFGGSIRMCYLMRASLIAMGVWFVVVVTSSAPHAAISVNHPSEGEIQGEKYADSVNLVDAKQARSIAILNEQKEVVESIARRYRVTDRAVAAFVVAAYKSGEELFVDPLLILAVIAVESSFNPVAESVLGAKGLMQVMAKFHREKIVVHGEEDVLLDPEVNVRIGTQILREYLTRFGETETALQMYAGAINDPDFAYSRKVLAEHFRIKQALVRLAARPE